jgi:hypothetical protein
MHGAKMNHFTSEDSVVLRTMAAKTASRIIFIRIG